MEREADNKLLNQIDDYITFKDVKPITKESYKRILIEYAKYVATLPKPPNRENIKTYREKLQDRLDARSVQKHIVIIRSFYEWLYAEGKGENIAIGIKGVRITDTYKREPLSEEQAKKLLVYTYKRSTEGTLELRNFAIISLMLTTGLRTIEVSRSDSVDIHYVEDAYALFIQGKGKDSKDDYVKLSKNTYDVIMKYLSARSDNLKPLFLNHSRNHKNNRISAKTVSVTIKEYLRDIGIDDSLYTAHSLRHTAAVMAMNSGASLFSAQQLLRHKNPATTQIYVNKITRRNENFEQVIDNKLHGLISEDKKE